MNIGSIVRLRAGGPHMTVQELRPGAKEEEILVKCIYIDERGQLTRPIFPQPCLEEVLPTPTQESQPNG